MGAAMPGTSTGEAHDRALGIIGLYWGNHPQTAELFRLVNYSNLPRISVPFLSHVTAFFDKIIMITIINYYL